MGLRSQLEKNIKSKRINIFLMFILLAILFSLLTKLSKDYTHTFRMDLESINVPEDKIIVSDSLQKLDITLTTYGFKLIRYQFARPKLEIDFDQLDQSENYFVWTRDRNFSRIVEQFDPNVRIEAINPDTLLFHFDNNTVKSVPVILNKDIEFASGYDVIGKINVIPDSVRVIGPGILVDSINSVETVDFSLKAVNSNIETVVQLDKLTNPQLRLSHQDVQIQAEVMKFTEGSVMVPVIVKNLPDDLELSIYPKNVEVIYYASLDAFKSIVPNSFIVECDYTETVDSELSFLIPKIITKPENVKEARLSTKRIEFILQ
ncbi:MAG: YbbR-like domain-containing protein [Bacteroidia bacterium]|nr:YbbR-like domain-containing protein [Bacteroidia bacterium]MBT8268846.1 YbbR-like domain-containing protein [Bacteroidia bacterium]NNF83332.1 YbbR-like domain-containing protein [Flavobacteriaceae bacterium]NNK70209.1 YbbR-like domain-containing protein [Flavobacteriaceae bacterium]